MWRLGKIREGGQLIFVLSGRLGCAQLPELQRTIESEAEGETAILDLEELKLVDHAVVQYLAQCEKSGMRLRKCPAYIREWMMNGNSQSNT